jgi:WD40 repeat protein
VANGDPSFVLLANGTSRVVDDWQPAVEILDAETGKTVVTLKLTTEDEDTVLAATRRVPPFEIEDLAFSPDGEVLAVGTSVGQVKLFKAKTGELIRSLDDEKAKLADKQTPDNLKSLTRAIGRVASLAFSPDGTLLATCGGSFEDDPLVFDNIERLGERGTGPGRLKIWEATTGTLNRDLLGHSQVNMVSFSPQGDLLASAGRWHDGGTWGSGTIVWNPQTGEQLRTLMNDDNGGTRAVTFSLHKKLVAIGSVRYDKENDTSTGVISVAYPLSGIMEWQRTFPGYAVPLAFSPDGKAFAVLCGGESVKLIATETGQVIHELAAADSIPGGRWNDLAIDRQSRTLAIGGVDGERKGSVEIWTAP